MRGTRALRPFHEPFEGLEALSCSWFVGPLWGPSSNHPLRGWYMIFAEQGESLNIEASVFVAADWYLGNFLGYTGFLERLRFAVDPGTNTFYFGPYAP